MARPHRASGSSVGLLRHCTYAFRADVKVPWEESGPAAKRGTRVHNAIESYLRDGEIVTLDHDAERNMFASFLTWHDAHPVAQWAVEIPMVLDVETRTVRVLPRVEHRDYGDIKPSEIPMTIDAVAYGRNRARYYDWKTSTKGEHSDQLMTGALALSLASDAYSDVSAAPVYVLEQAAHTGDVLEPDALDLDAHEAMLRRQLRVLPTADPTPGPWCKDKWCKLREKCPAHRAWLKENR